MDSSDSADLTANSLDKKRVSYPIATFLEEFDFKCSPSARLMRSTCLKVKLSPIIPLYPSVPKFINIFATNHRKLVCPEGFEPSASGVGVLHSIQMSYGH